MDAVATCVRADEEEEIARAIGAGPLQVLDAGKTDAHGVHQRVPGVRVLERDLAADGRDAQAVAVAADTADDATEKGAVSRASPLVRVVTGLQRAESQRIEERHRPGAHGKDVTDDAADAGRGALVWLDGGGMVV